MSYGKHGRVALLTGDGKVLGLPRSLGFGSRIIAIADYLDRSTNHEQSGTMLHNVMKNLKNLAGRSFDQNLIHHFDETVSAVFDTPDINREQTEIIPVKELAAGMIMGEELYTISRILLAGRGKTVTAETLENIRRSLLIDPPATTKILASRLQSQAGVVF